MVFSFIQKNFPGQHESYNINFFCRTKRIFFSQIMKITNVFFNPISAFAQTNLIIELKLTVYLFSKKLGTDHLTSRGKMFPDNMSYNIYFFCRTKRNFFSPKFNIRLYDKNSETYFFSLHQNQNIVFSNNKKIRVLIIHALLYIWLILWGIKFENCGLYTIHVEVKFMMMLPFPVNT
jgi:hypothetical protein